MADILTSASDVMLQTFDYLNTPALIINAGMKIVALNAAANAIFSYASAEIIGLNLAELVTQTSGSAGEETGISTGGQQSTAGVHYESICKKKDGELFIAQVSVIPYPSDHQRLVVLKDISDLRTLQLGKQLGIALENDRLIVQLRDKMRQIELINELSGIINSSLSMGTVFRIMASEIRKLVSYDRASLL